MLIIDYNLSYIDTYILSYILEVIVNTYQSSEVAFIAVTIKYECGAVGWK